MVLISISNMNTCHSAKDYFVFVMAEMLSMAFNIIILFHQLHHSTVTHKALPGHLKQVDFSNNCAHHQIRKVTGQLTW